MKIDNIIISVLLFIVVSTILYYHYKYNRLVKVKSNVNGKRYKVRDIYNKMEAANILAEIDNRLSFLKKYLINTNSDNQKLIKRVNRFDSSNLQESSRFSQATSFTINKKTLVLCMRSKQNENTLKDLNTLMFVALHEFTHIVSDCFGHTSDYWSNFKYILQLAIKINIYDKQNYNNNPEKYCGITINNSPLYLNSIKAKLT